MITPAFWCTILISNYALKRCNVPREIVTFSTSEIDFAIMSQDELIGIASPREHKDGSIFYLSNGIVSWINSSIIDYEDISEEWEDEITMLKAHGLQFGLDMVRVQWSTEKDMYTCDEKQYIVDCKWLKLLRVDRVWSSKEELDNASGDVNYGAILWVDESKMFKGYDIRKIKHE